MSNTVTQHVKKPVLVVGGAGAIGSAIASRIEQNGRNVVVLDRQQPGCGKRPFQLVDITSDASVEVALDHVVQRFGVPEVLICATGYLSGASVLDLSKDDIQAHLDVNLFGAFNVAQRTARLMRGAGGKILFISSIHGQIGVPNRGAYAMSKAALGALARAMAVELSANNIRVNVLAPGAVNAGMSPDPEARRYWQCETPAGRVANVEEIARFADMLTSDQASFVTGQTIAVDGGASTLRPIGVHARAIIS